MGNKLIYTYTEPKTENFWWITYWIATGIGFLLGIGFIAGPFILLMSYPTLWLLLLIPVVILGLWMNRGIARSWKSILWKQKHRSSYQLYEDRIETLEWPNLYMAEPRERSISFSEITSVIASYYIVRETITQGLLSQRITENAPILYVLYTDVKGPQIQNILFPNHSDAGINKWFRQLQQAQIPLLYNARQLYRIDTPILSDQSRLEYLLDTDENIEFPFTTAWLKDEPSALAEWQKVEIQKRYIAEAKDPSLKEARKKHSFRKWLISSLLPLQLMAIMMFMTTELGKSYNVQSANVLPGLGIFLFGGFLFFFLLKSHLRWYYMFTYYAVVLFLGFTSFIAAATEGPLALGMGYSSLLFPAFIWIPYFAIKKISKKPPGSIPKDAAW